MKNMHSFIYTAISASLFSAFSASTMANEAPMENIVVSGSRVIESIDEVPASITVIGPEQVAEYLKVTPELQSMLSMFVPGMAPDTGSSSNTGQTLRGRSPLVMIDGVPQSTPLRNGSLGVKTLDPSVIERIEIIKGATSIYGNGAAGGIINYITKRAARSGVEGEVSLSSRFSAVKVAESAGVRTEAMLNGREGKFSYLFAASYEENGVQRDAEGDILGLQYGLSDTVTQNYFTKLGYQFDADKQLQMSFNYYSSQQETDLADVFGDLNTGQKSYAIHASEDLQKRGEPQGPDGNTNFTVKYTDYDVFANTQMTLDYYQQDINNVFFFSPVLANPDEGYNGGQSIIKSEKKGLRGTFNTNISLNEHWQAHLIYGVDFLNDVTSQPLVDGRIWVPEMDMENVAGFVQTKWLYDDNIIIKAGVRNENIDLQVDDYSTLKLCRSEDQCSEVFSVKGDELNYQATTYNAAVKITYLPYFQPFVSYSQGADISDIGRLLRTATVFDIADIRTEASIIDNYEIGFTSQINQNIRVETAIFKSTSELGTTNSFDETTGVYMPVRAPQKIWGFEALFNWQINEQLRLVSTYSISEGKDTENNLYLGGKYISPAKTTLHLNWTPYQDTSVNINYVYVDSRKRFAPDEDGNYVGDQGPVSAYDLVNVNAKYQLTAAWQTFVGIENLFNADYYPSRAQAYTYGGYNVKGLGTTVNLGVQYQF